ncbi:MAG: chloride channel protein [Haloarculaceae archaeon]
MTSAKGWVKRTFSATLASHLSLQDDELRMNVLAIAVGIITGLGAVFFRITIFVVQELAFGTNMNPGSVEFEQIPFPNLFDVLGPLGPLRYLLIPGLGGLVVGFIIVATTREVSGHGVPKVLIAVLSRGGKIDPKIALYKTIASSVAIGTGGSLGREGPIVQIGSAAGSYFGRFVENKAYTRTLVAAGAAGGIAATFDAPLGGIMFSLEIILAEYSLSNVIAVVITAVTAVGVAQPILHFSPNPGIRAFLVPVSFRLVNPLIEFPLYIILGLVVGLAGVLTVKMLYGVEELVLEDLDAPFYVKPALGGVLLGLSALIASFVLGVSPLQGATWLFGVGYDTITEVIKNNLLFPVLVVLGLMKAIGFSLSVGTGSSGGVFSPSLYIGAMVGGAFGVAVQGVPHTAHPGAYALVAMAGLFAAAARAPLTSTLIVFELTGQYTIILPLLLVTVVGSELAHWILEGGTIYTEKLRDMGLTIQERRIGSLENISVWEVMTGDVDTVTAGDCLDVAIQRFRETKHHGLPIVDDDGTLVGIITLYDVQMFMSGDHPYFVDADEYCDSPPVEEVGTTDVLTVNVDDNLLVAVDIMEGNDIGRLPVVDDEGALVGMLTRSDVLDVYDNLPAPEEDIDIADEE